MAKNTDKQGKKQGGRKIIGQYNWLKEYQWQKGQSGNPKGRPKGKTMKEFARNFLENMSEESRIKFLKTMDPDKVWRMAEGQPHVTTDLTTAGKPIPLLANLDVSNNNGDKKDRPANKKD